MLERLGNSDRLFLEGIRSRARLVDSDMHSDVVAWQEANRGSPTDSTSLSDIISPPRDSFLVSALPMTRSVDDLVSGYLRMSSGGVPSDDAETAACIFHDLANYGIGIGLAEDAFRSELASRFFNHPFIRKLDEFIAPEAYFGRIKAWVQDNCADVPVPSRRDLTGNVQVLLEWFVGLGGGRYAVDVPGIRSQRIRKA